ncbi:hypothetical protein [Limnoglobus roseus]|uniref:Lipoprotein n=1 Tax=Limnoglobus roseus TaxID=2598579 RepID=A0A5C1ALT3_9BACT|nr:hypothetical protein [Limnoglobus roseus]QEL17868.1 hypothetical protein PX52LOC_04879 [Limnoglobus roseus]
MRTRSMSGGLLLLAVGLMAGCGKKDQTSPPAAPDSKGGNVAQSLTPEEAGRLKQAVTDGDALWDAAVQGVKEAKIEAKSAAKKKYDDAFEKYMVVVNAPQPLPDKAVMARVYGRVIDVAVDRKKNKTLAKEVAVKSLRAEILPVCSSPEASPILAAARKELKAEDKELDEWLEKEGKQGGKQGGGTKGDKSAATAEDLQKLSYAQIVQRLGEPDEDYRSKKKDNMGLAIWETDDGLYTVVSFVHAIDGSGRTVVLTVHDKRSRSIVENMKRALDNPKK